MKRSLFITVFIAAHLFFVFFQIHQHSQIIKLSYRKQKNELTLKKLTQQKLDLTQQLYVLKNKSAIKDFAQQELAMQPINIGQIKKLDLNEQKLQV